MVGRYLVLEVLGLCDWESGEIIGRDVEATNVLVVGLIQHFLKNSVFRSGTGSLLAITAEDFSYILRFDWDAYNAKLEGAEITNEGVEEAFEVVADLPER